MTTDHTDMSIGVLLERFATDACNKNFLVDLSIKYTPTFIVFLGFLELFYPY